MIQLSVWIAGKTKAPLTGMAKGCEPDYSFDPYRRRI